MLERLAAEIAASLDEKRQVYDWADWAGLVSKTIFILSLLYTYLFWLNPNDPNHIYQTRELQLDPTNEDIRILILEPGEWEDPIRCRLEKIGLGSDPQFVALSYAWVEKYPHTKEKERKTIADYVEYAYCCIVSWLERHRHKKVLQRVRMIFGDMRKQIIYVNGRKHEVGINLELALRHLRIDRDRLAMMGRGELKQKEDHGMGKGDLALWADAVCINQDDVEDRNRQVSSMREVYKKAQKVEIWLGAERDFQLDESTDKVVNESRELSMIARNPRNGYDIIWEPADVDDTGYGDAQEIPDPQSPVGESDDDARVKKTIKTWETFHNRPKLLRAEVEPDYTLEFFCMLHLLQKTAFQDCEIGHHRPLDERIPFLKQASARAHVLEVFREVMDRLWWNRLWVVQETVIAKKVDVRYGRFVIPWDNLVLAAKNLKKHRHKHCCVAGFEVLPSEDVDVLTRFADTVLGLDIWRKGWTTDARKDKVDIRLLRLLWQFRDRQTSEARDKVYALLPLVTDWGRAEKHNVVHPKYDWPVAGVYANVVRNLLFVEGSLLVLAGNARKTEKLSDLPSWAPDWSQPPEPGEIARLARMTLYRASGDEKMEFRILGSNEFLELKGIRHSVVKEIAEDMVPEHDAASYAKTQRTFQTWERLALLDDPEKAKEQYQGLAYSRQTAYYKTMCMDTVLAPKAEDASKAEVNKLEFLLAEDTFGDGMRKWEEYSAKHYTLPPKGSNTGAKRAPPDPIFVGFKQRSSKLANAVDRVMALRETAHHDSSHPGLKRQDTPQNYLATQINETVESATVSRRFFITDDGHMGLAPAETQVGDHVFVLFGGQVPFMLRKAGRRTIPRHSSVLDGQYRSERPQATEAEGQAGAQTNVRPQTPPQRMRPFDLLTPQKKYRHRNSGCGQTECYRLIGDCYVQGLMRGEALADSQKARRYVYLV